MNHQTKVILRTVTTVMVCLAIVFAFLISAIRIFGLDIYGVLTGSMEPTYPVGSLIYVKKVDPEELRVRDVITYSLTPNTVVTHRIVELVPDEKTPTSPASAPRATLTTMWTPRWSARPTSLARWFSPSPIWAILPIISRIRREFTLP